MVLEPVTMTFKGVCTVSIQGNGDIMIPSATNSDEITIHLGTTELFTVSIKTSKLDDEGGAKKVVEVCTKDDESSINKQPDVDASTNKEPETPRYEAQCPVGFASIGEDMVQLNEHCWVSPTKDETFNETGEIEIDESDKILVRSGLKEEFEESQGYF